MGVAGSRPRFSVGMAVEVPGPGRLLHGQVGSGAGGSARGELSPLAASGGSGLFALWFWELQVPGSGLLLWPREGTRAFPSLGQGLGAGGGGDAGEGYSAFGAEMALDTYQLFFQVQLHLSLYPRGGKLNYSGNSV